MSHQLGSLLLLDIPVLRNREAHDVAASRRLATDVSALFERVCEGERGVVLSLIGLGSPLSAHFGTVTEAYHAANEVVRLGTQLSDPAQLRVAIHVGELPSSDSAKVACQAFIDAHSLLECAHEGQVLVSGTAQSLLPDEVRSLADLGRRRLADSTREMRVFAVANNLFSDSRRTALATDTPTTNLPRALTRFVGRQDEVDDTCSRFYLSRLVTIVGPGGIGKTRLAIRVADELQDRHPDGTWYVNLADLQAGGSVDEAVAQLFNVVYSHEVSPSEALARHLRDHEALLVLDNCEHVSPSVALLVAKLSRDCRNIAVLATSRKRLGMDGESVVNLLPMGLPDKDDRVRVEESDAVRLFLDRAQVGDPGYDPSAGELVAIGELCRRLDGIPLAIELAAAQAHLSIGKIRLTLGSRKSARLGGTARFGSLESAIRWSLSLVDNRVRQVFFRLAVFESGFEAPIAAEVCTSRLVSQEVVLAALSQLSDHSLLSLDSEGRFRLLQPVREVALRSLRRSSLSQALLDRHLEAFCRILDSATLEDSSAQRTEWVARELPNLRLALRTALAHGNAEMALTLVTKLFPYWNMKGMWHESLDAMDAVMEMFEDVPETKVRLMNFTLALSNTLGDLKRAEEIFETAEPLAKVHSPPEMLAALEGNMGVALRLNGRLVDAQAYLMRAVEALTGRESLPVYWVLKQNLAALEADLYPSPETRALINECLEHCRPEAPFHRANLVYSLGVCYLGEGKLSEARECLETALKSFHEADAPKGIYMSLRALAKLSALDGLDHHAVLYAAASFSMEERARPTSWERSRFWTSSLLEELRDRLGAQRFDAEYRQGYRGGVEELVENMASEIDRK